MNKQAVADAIKTVWTYFHSDRVPRGFPADVTLAIGILSGAASSALDGLPGGIVLARPSGPEPEPTHHNDDAF